MPKGIPKFYWDACCWLGLINNEAAKHKELLLVWEGAKRAQCELYTSAYTYLEVVKAKPGPADPLTEAESDKRVDDILDQPFVEVIQVDTIIAKLARRLRRAYPTELQQKADAIHLASAAHTNMDALHTYDGARPGAKSKLLLLDGKIPRRNGTLLRICMPDTDAYGPLWGGPKDIGDGSKKSGDG